LVEKSENKLLLWRLKRIWDDNVKNEIYELRCEAMNWIQPA